MQRLSLTLFAITATAISVSVLTKTPIAFAQPAPIVAQGGDRGPAIFVPTDVTGTQIEVVEQTSIPASALRVRFERFPEKFNCKKFLLQEDVDTKCSELSEGSITLERGKILVAPRDGRLLVHTKVADISVPKDGIALIKCENDQLSFFNLGGREFVVHFPLEPGHPHHKTSYEECIGLDEGFGIVSHGTKDSVGGGILQYAGRQAASSVVVAVAMHNCKLAVIDPMKILEEDSILKSLTAEKWLSVLRKVEDTAERVGVWQREQSRR